MWKNNTINVPAWTGLLLGCFILLACTACGSGQTQNSKYYANDGYLGLTNTNPSLQTSPSYHTYSDDKAIIVETLRNFPEVRRSRIILEGDAAHVRVTLDRQLTEAQVNQLRVEIQEALDYMLPRYDVNLTYR